MGFNSEFKGLKPIMKHKVLIQVFVLSCVLTCCVYGDKKLSTNTFINTNIDLNVYLMFNIT